MESFDCDGRVFRDARGRMRIFRGANVSGKGKVPPFDALDDPTALETLRAWGFNVIRLLVTWEAIEPRRGEIDDDYLDRVQALAEHAGRLGLHVLVDFHQDLFSREHGGDGAPAWAVQFRGKRARGRTWFFHYLINAAVRRSQRAFWGDVDGIQAAFFRAARRVVERMRDVAAVLGYDVWNEPMSGLRHMLSGAFEGHALAQFQQQWIRMRDELHPRAMLLFEPLPLVPFGFPSRMPTPTADHIVYAPHLYDATAMGLGRYVRWASTFEPSLRRVLATAQRLNVPLFVGEFGILGGVHDARALIEEQCRRFDQHFVSWTAWHYSPGIDDWNDEDASIVGPDGSDRPWTAALVRPYPRALDGTPKVWDSPQAGPWTLTYAPAGMAPTEIVVPSRWAGVGLEVEVDGATHGWEHGVLMIEPSAATEVTVRLHRG